jgi:hypothetical protein
MKLDSKLEADRKVIPKWNLSAKTIRLDLHRGRRSLLGQALIESSFEELEGDRSRRKDRCPR